MITSWPSGPSPQISMSGSKSGLSLYANVASCNLPSPPFPHHRPANQPGARVLSGPPSNRSAPANNALQNQHQAFCRRQKRSDIRGNRRDGGAARNIKRRLAPLQPHIPSPRCSPPLYTARRSLAARPPPIIFRSNVLIGQLWLCHAVTRRRRWKRGGGMRERKRCN